ncbi:MULTISPECIES: YeeE/YedE thiosulfate transporter family protein [unclassified Cyanobium]|uniref:YeeE/YedE thiosulfate transporter family protein n=1 Tax=unclassified Cyanobium TaxID=2627006 RepID=UPI0020CCF18D|nr:MULTISPECIES: YeeE/YedE thiosulfate transporter family protein [unclassified Cyanobium]MCP9835147.1 YeeE/YedE family protein [Cyanobium sp. La Preciosa 7G6]MCP9937910.1 YeeE/YedE family protein [Cyanobium sp. Aljojuca 7A6]
MKQPLRTALAVAPAIAIGVALAARQPASALVWGLGCGLGHGLVRSDFGFASGYRRLLERRDPGPSFAQLLLVALLVIAMALVLAFEPLTGLRPKLLATPLSLPFLAGAFLFGIGMERARGCGCGTLAAASQGGGGVVAALIGLVVGAFLGTLHAPQLAALGLPRLPSPSGLELFGLAGSVVLQLALIALIAVLLWRWTGQLPWRGEGRGPYGGAVALAVLATGLLLVTAEPWKVLWGLALSGAHTAQALGWDPQTSLFWSSPRGQVQLAGWDAWLFNDAVLVDLGLLYGAVATAIGQGRFRWRGERSQAMPELARRGFGGLLMGYGGLLASGCNVNAFLGGVMSFSLHGWIWLAVALLGFAASLRLSPAA